MRGLLRRTKLFVPFGILVMLLAAALTAGTTSAHSPLFPSGNEALSHPFNIPDDTKSWAIYAQLEGGERAAYYDMSVTRGDHLLISLIAASDPNATGFLPSFALMGPGLGRHDSLPAFVQVPASVDVIRVDGSEPSNATYESFSPGYFYETAGLEMNATANGTYYIAVFASGPGGNYALAPGFRESYTPVEIILLPPAIVRVYVWQGEGLLSAIAPLLAVLVIGIGLVVWRRKGLSATRWLMVISGLGFTGWALMLVYHIFLALTKVPFVNETFITLMFVGIAATLGAIMLASGLAKEVKGRSLARIKFLAIAIVGTILWSGLYLGPGLALVLVFLPKKFMR